MTVAGLRLAVIKNTIEWVYSVPEFRTSTQLDWHETAASVDPTRWGHLTTSKCPLPLLCFGGGKDGHKWVHPPFMTGKYHRSFSIWRKINKLIVIVKMSWANGRGRAPVPVNSAAWLLPMGSRSDEEEIDSRQFLEVFSLWSWTTLFPFRYEGRLWPLGWWVNFPNSDLNWGYRMLSHLQATDWFRFTKHAKEVTKAFAFTKTPVRQ